MTSDNTTPPEISINSERPGAVEHIESNSFVNTRLDADSPPGAVTPRAASDASGLPLKDVGEGWKVYDTNQQQIGTVDLANAEYLQVHTGTVFGRTLYIPGGLVGSVDRDQRRVFLTQAKATIDEMDLANRPADEPAGSDPRWEAATASAIGMPPAAPYVLDSSSRDRRDGPTHQPGTAPGYIPTRGQPTEYAPFRSPTEHNEVDLNLRLNKAHDGDPFGTQEETEGTSIPPGAPAAANRELPNEAGETRQSPKV